MVTKLNRLMGGCAARDLEPITLRRDADDEVPGSGWSLLQHERLLKAGLLDTVVLRDAPVTIAQCRMITLVRNHVGCLPDKACATVVGQPQRYGRSQC